MDLPTDQLHADGSVGIIQSKSLSYLFKMPYIIDID